MTWGRFKNAYDVLNMKTLIYLTCGKTTHFSMYGLDIFVEFQKVPSKFLTHTLKDAIFTQCEILRVFRFKTS